MQIEESLQSIVQTTSKLFWKLFYLQASVKRFSYNFRKLHEISGIIDFIDGVQGSLTISFPEKTALELVGRLCKKPCLEVNATVIDGIGEIANLICGNSKAELSKKNHGNPIQFSIPHVIIGRNYLISHPRGVQSMAAHFESDFGKFLVELSLKTKEWIGHKERE